MILIDANKLKEYIEREVACCGFIKEMNIFEAFAIIDKQPLADYLTHAHWIEDKVESSDGSTDKLVMCSNCKALYGSNKELADDKYYGMNYCPKCGAWMKGDRNE